MSFLDWPTEEKRAACNADVRRKNSAEGLIARFAEIHGRAHTQASGRCALGERRRLSPLIAKKQKRPQLWSPGADSSANVKGAATLSRFGLS